VNPGSAPRSFRVHAMKLDRRWWVAIGVAVVAVVAIVYTVVRQPPEECRPVQALLDFNSSQSELIASKSGDSADSAVPSLAEVAAYQQWADGLAQRAGQVNEPSLANTAVQVADQASQFVAKLPRLRAETQARAPGAPAPPVVYEMSVLNQRITDGLDELAKACHG
jgi:hypothetical protein